MAEFWVSISKVPLLFVPCEVRQFQWSSNDIVRALVISHTRVVVPHEVQVYVHAVRGGDNEYESMRRSTMLPRYVWDCNEIDEDRRYWRRDKSAISSFISVRQCEGQQVTRGIRKSLRPDTSSVRGPTSPRGWGLSHALRRIVRDRAECSARHSLLGWTFSRETENEEPPLRAQR